MMDASKPPDGKGRPDSSTLPADATSERSERPDSASIHDASRDAPSHEDAPVVDAGSVIYGACLTPAGVTTLEIQERDLKAGTCIRLVLEDGGTCPDQSLSGWCVRTATFSWDLPGCGSNEPPGGYGARPISGDLSFLESDIVQLHAILYFGSGPPGLPSEAHLDLAACSVAGCSFTRDCRVQP